MEIKAVVDTSVSPFQLVITSSESRNFGGTLDVKVLGSSASTTYSGTFPFTVTDSSNRVWTKQSDNGTTAVYTG